MNSPCPAPSTPKTAATPNCWLAARLAILAGLAGALWGAVAWLGQPEVWGASAAARTWLFQPLVTGNLALLSLLVWLDAEADARWPGHAGVSVKLWLGGVGLTATATALGLAATNLWGSDLGVYAAILLPASLCLITVLLQLAVRLVASPGRRAALLAGFLGVSGWLVEMARPAAGRSLPDHFERVLVANSVQLGLAVLVWLALWGASAGDEGEPEPLSPPTSTPAHAGHPSRERPSHE